MTLPLGESWMCLGIHLLVVPAGQRTPDLGFAFGMSCGQALPGFRDLWVASPLVRHFVGPKTTNQASDNRVGPTGPIPQQPSQLPVPPAFVCELCSRSFASKIGLGVHFNRAHPVERDQKKKRVEPKARWCDEEIHLVALKEAELLKGGARFLNQELAKHFPSRTVEALKKLRQRNEYKARVLSLGKPTSREPMASLSSSSSDDEVFVDARPVPGEEPQLVAPTPSTPPVSNDAFITYLLNLPAPKSDSYDTPTLLDIVDRALPSGRAETLNRLTLYLRAVLSCGPGNVRQPKERRHIPPRNNRQRRRREYAETQNNWRKHQSRCIQSILDGPSTARMPPRDVMEPYRTNVMVAENTRAPGDDPCLRQDLASIWRPISTDDLERNKVPLAASPGPDGITARQIRAIPCDVLCRIVNLILWCGRLPIDQRDARTTFVPKKADAVTPGDFRPITVPSTLARLVHSILARRIISTARIDQRQRAFIPSDGVAQNTILLDLFLRDQQRRYAKCYLTSLDVSKAFDSVSHNAIFGTLRSFGFPQEFISYLSETYSSATTRLKGEGWASEPIHPKGGVKQGDPLSPILFNLVIDRLLRRLPADVGAYIDSAKVNALAFADDIVLAASTPEGLQGLIDTTARFLDSCGMALNPAKCLTLSILGQPKRKTSVVDGRVFNINGRPIPALTRADTWGYLGIMFQTTGRVKINPSALVGTYLDRLTKAPLSPQQRLHALRTVLLPKVYHTICLGSVMIGCLNKMDRLVRAAVRKWLALPHDVPVGYFHAAVRDGGLGIPSLRWQGPLLRRNRLLGLRLPNLEESTCANIFLAKELESAESRLRYKDNRLLGSDAICLMWKRRLYQSVDGRGLRQADLVPQAHRWIREPTRFLSGRDFVHLNQLRINAVPSRSRTARGRPQKDRWCRAGCDRVESTNHILQQCSRTHGPRIYRHDAVTSYVRRALEAKGFHTVLEDKFDSHGTCQKPDIVAVSPLGCFIIDSQVVTDGIDLEVAHHRKVEKYLPIRRLAAERYQTDVESTHVLSVTLNWRGVWCQSSAGKLVGRGLLSTKDIAVISTRVLVGGVNIFRGFNRNTAVVHGPPAAAS